MPRPLLSASALASIRRIGEGQMVTEVDIFRTSVVGVTSPSYSAQYDYGDDEVAEAEVYEGSVAVGESVAWFFTSALEREIGSEDDQLTTIDLHEVRMPIGTDVRVHDIIRRRDNGEQFTVVDTNGSDTWAEKLRATVRRREG